MKTFTQWLVEGRSFEYGGKKYSSGFGRYTCDGNSISKEEYQRASEAYKSGVKPTVKPTTPTKPKKTAKPTKTEKPTKKVSSISTKKPKTEFDRIHAKSKTYQMLQNNPFTPSKTLKECEKKIESYADIHCHLAGITDKEVFNGIAQSIHKVFSRYPFIGDSKELKYIATQTGMNKSVEKDVEAYMNQPEVRERIQSDFDYIKEKRGFTKIGTEAYKNVWYIPMTNAESKKFRAKHNITTDTIVDEKLAKVLKDTYFDIQLERVKKKYKNSIMPNMGSTKGAFAFYMNSDYEQSSWKKFAGIYMSPSNMKKSKVLYDLGVLNKYHPQGTHHDSIITHEIGHAMDFILDLRHDEEIRALYKSGDPTDTVSKYARTNIKEFISECFAEYINSEKPREMATKVGKIIDKKYQAWAEVQSRFNDINLGELD